MSYWNRLYKIYNQKEMTNRQKQVQQQKNDKLCWGVGFVIMSLLIGLFVWFIIELKGN